MRGFVPRTTSRPSSATSRFLVGLLLAWTLGCGGDPPERVVEPGEPAKAEPEGAGLIPVPRPDSTAVVQPARGRLEQAFAELREAVERPAADAEALAQAYGIAGTVFLAAGSYGSAEAALRNAETLSPGNADWSYFLGHAYLGKDEGEPAIASFRRVLDSNPDDVACLVWLGRTLHDQSEAEQAEVAFRRALELSPEAASAMLGLGRAALAQRNHAEAVRWLSETLKLQPQASIVHYPLALAYQGLGDARKAEEHLAQRGETDLFPFDPRMDRVRGVPGTPGPASAGLSGGHLAYAEGRFEDAATEFRAALERAPDDPRSRVNLASALFRLGDLEGADEQYAAVLQDHPQHPRAHFGAGIVLERGAADARAAEHYRAALAGKPAFEPAHLRLGHIANRAGRLEEAVRYYDAAVRSDPRNSEARFAASLIRVRLGEFAESRRELEEAIAALPGQTAFAHALARILVASPDDAARDAPRAFELLESLSQGSANTDLGETVAMALAEAGEFEQAVQWQRSVISTVEGAGRSDLLGPMAARLELYESGRPCRRPWNEDDPIFVAPRNPDPGPPEPRSPL